MLNPPDKHLPYYEMRDALKKPGCAVCFLVHDRIAKFLDNLLYEGITDPKFLDQFETDRGFCLAHTRQFLDARDGLAVGLAHRSLLLRASQDIQSGKAAALSDLRTKACLICRAMAETENRHLKVLRDYLKDPELGLAIRESKGICLPHYGALERLAKSLPEWFKRFQVKKYNELLERLDTYLASQNVKPDQPPPHLSPEEVLSWETIVLMLFGDSGVQK